MKTWQTCAAITVSIIVGLLIAILTYEEDTKKPHYYYVAFTTPTKQIGRAIETPLGLSEGKHLMKWIHDTINAEGESIVIIYLKELEGGINESLAQKERL